MSIAGSDIFSVENTRIFALFLVPPAPEGELPLTPEGELELVLSCIFSSIFVIQCIYKLSNPKSLFPKRELEVFSNSPLGVGGRKTFYFFFMYTLKYPFSSAKPRYSCPCLLHHFGMSCFVPSSDDRISITSPALMVPIAFLASNSGPGHAVPRASTDFATSTDFNSSAVIIVNVKDLPPNPLKGEFEVQRSLLIIN